MSHWHFQKLKLFTLFVITTFTFGNIVKAELRSDTGAKSDDEAKTLWQDAQKFKQEGKLKEAAAELERFVARYPAAPGFTEAHGLLGETYLLLNQPLKALKPLQFALEAHPSASSTRAGLQLTRTTGLVMLKRWNEALLSANEILLKAPKNPELLAHASLLKGEALAGLKEKLRAQQSLESARSEFAAGLTPELQQEASMLEMELKLNDCSLLPSKGSLSEDQAREQMNRRGVCLLEGVQKYVLLFKQPSSVESTREHSNERVITKATDLLSQAFTLHQMRCKNPPPPLPLVTDQVNSQKPKPRTQVQLKRYRAELAFTLEKECRENFRQAAEALESVDLSKVSSLQKKQHGKVMKSALTLSSVKQIPTQVKRIHK